MRFPAHQYNSRAFNFFLFLSPIDLFLSQMKALELYQLKDGIGCRNVKIADGTGKENVIQISKTCILFMGTIPLVMTISRASKTNVVIVYGVLIRTARFVAIQRLPEISRNVHSGPRDTMPFMMPVLPSRGKNENIDVYDNIY